MSYKNRSRLEAADQQLRMLTENMPAGAYTMVRQPGETFARFDYVSGAFANMCGLTREEALADPVAALTRCIHPGDLARWLELNQQAFATRTKFYGETRLVVDGKIRWVRAESIPRVREDGAIVWEGEGRVTLFVRRSRGGIQATDGGRGDRAEPVLTRDQPSVSRKGHPVASMTSTATPHARRFSHQMPIIPSASRRRIREAQPR